MTDDKSHPKGTLCIKHIYNKSNATWIITFNPFKTYSMNFSVKCGYTFTSIDHGQSFTMLAGDIKTIRYDDGACAMVTCTDTYGLHPLSFKMEWVSDVAGLWPYPYIEHSGNTGAITVNQPADGDITCTFDYWSNL